MYLLKKATFQFMTSLVLFFSIFSSVAFAANLEIINGNLFDSRTGLTWQRLDAAVVTQLPLDPQLNGARIATWHEIDYLLPLTFGNTTSISIGSDIYKALSFFSSSFSSPVVNSPMSNCANCFSAWVQGFSSLINPTLNYEQAFYTFSTVTLPPRIGIPALTSTTYSGVSTIGSYDANSPWCRDCNGALFTVLSVPEPSTAALLPLGILLLIVKSRRKNFSLMGFFNFLTPQKLPLNSFHH